MTAPRAAAEPRPAAVAPARGTTLEVVLGVALVLGVVGLQILFQRHAGGLWRDEVTGVNVATLPSFAEVRGSAYFDSFALAWNVIFHGWATYVGATDAALRRLGFVVGVATPVVLWWTVRRFGPGAPLVSVALAGMSPSMVVYGGSVRGYGFGALAVLLSAGTLWTFVRRPRPATYALAQLAALLAVQTYLPNAILLFALCLAAAAVCLRRGAGRIAAATLAIGAVAALSLVLNVPWVTYAFQVGALEQGDWPLRRIASVFLAALAPEVPVLAAAWALGAVAAIVGFVLAWRTPRDGADRDEADADRDRALFFAVGVPVGLAVHFWYLTYVARLPTQHWYYLSVIALLAVAIDVGAWLAARRVRGGPAARAAIVALVVIASARDLVATVPVRMTTIDLAAATIARDATPRDLAVVFPWFCGITFDRYYRGPAPWITIPDVSDHKFHRHLLIAERMKEGSGAIAGELARVEATLRDGGRVWVVGPLTAPPEGATLPVLPPAPGPRGWRAAPYLDNWELQLGALLRTHARDVWSVTLPDVGPVNAWENMPLIVAEGWR